MAGRRPTYADGFADGVNHVALIIARELAAAMAEPRTQPSDRRGRITALGALLQRIAPTIDYREETARGR